MKHTKTDVAIYAMTEKPTCYREVRNPPRTDAEKRARPQDARQVQFNRWCMAKKVFCGSYLPRHSEVLLHCGWEETENSRKSKVPFNSEWRRKSTGQEILRHGYHVNRSGKAEQTHYHWENPEAKFVSGAQSDRIAYFNKYGEVVPRKSGDSHIQPWRTKKRT